MCWGLIDLGLFVHGGGVYIEVIDGLRGAAPRAVGATLGSLRAALAHGTLHVRDDSLGTEHLQVIIKAAGLFTLGRSRVRGLITKTGSDVIGAIGVAGGDTEVVRIYMFLCTLLPQRTILVEVMGVMG